MKKVTLIAAAALVVLSMASCKKTYHCECSSAGYSVKSPSEKLSRKDAKEVKKKCESGSTTVAGVTVTCKFVKE
jgi:hypothetical protein